MGPAGGILDDERTVDFKNDGTQTEIPDADPEPPQNEEMQRLGAQIGKDIDEAVAKVVTQQQPLSTLPPEKLLPPSRLMALSQASDGPNESNVVRADEDTPLFIYL